MERCVIVDYGFLSHSLACKAIPKGSHPSRSHITICEKSYRALGEVLQEASASYSIIGPKTVPREF
jgi:hypothetical protein